MGAHIKASRYVADVSHAMAIMSKASVVFLSAALPLGLLPAQSELILPPSHELQVGTGSTNVPFGRSTPNRVQMAYDAMLFPSPVVIEGLAFRLQEGELAASKMVELDLLKAAVELEFSKKAKLIPLNLKALEAGEKAALKG